MITFYESLNGEPTEEKIVSWIPEYVEDTTGYAFEVIYARNFISQLRIRNTSINTIKYKWDFEENWSESITLENDEYYTGLDFKIKRKKAGVIGELVIRPRIMFNNTLAGPDLEILSSPDVRYSAIFIKADEDVVIEELYTLSNVWMTEPVKGEDAGSLPGPDDWSDSWSGMGLELDEGEYAYIWLKFTTPDATVGPVLYSFGIDYENAESVFGTQKVVGAHLIEDSTLPKFRLYGAYSDDEETLPNVNGDFIDDNNTGVFSFEPVPDMIYYRFRIVKVDKYGFESQNKYLDLRFVLNEEHLLEDEPPAPELEHHEILPGGAMLFTLKITQDPSRQSVVRVGVLTRIFEDPTYTEFAQVTEAVDPFMFTSTRNVFLPRIPNHAFYDYYIFSLTRENKMTTVHVPGPFESVYIEQPPLPQHNLTGIGKA